MLLQDEDDGRGFYFPMVRRMICVHACVHSTHFISLWLDTTIMPRHTPAWTVGAPPNSYLHAPPFIANLSPYYLLVTDTEFVAPPGLPGQLQAGMWMFVDFVGVSLTL